MLLFPPISKTFPLQSAHGVGKFRLVRWINEPEMLMSTDLPTAFPSPHTHPQAGISPWRVPEGERPFILVNTHSSSVAGLGQSKPAVSKSASLREASAELKAAAKPPHKATRSFYPAQQRHNTESGSIPDPHHHVHMA